MSATLLWLRLFFCGFLVIAAMLGVTLLTPVFYGDLTRIGYLSEHDFGWTAPQPAMAEGDLRSARFADADVLVLGDSFSAKLPERVNDFATPRVINLLCRVECFGLTVSPWVAG